MHLNRGVIFADYLRRDAEAERELRLALAIQPGFVPALLNLATSRKTAAGEPRPWNCTNAPWNWIRTAPWPWRATRTCRAPAAATLELIGQLQAALRRPELHRTDQALLCFALGRALDAGGSYEGAFGAYVAGNLSLRPVPRRPGCTTIGAHWNSSLTG